MDQDFSEAKNALRQVINFYKWKFSVWICNTVTIYKL